MVGITYISVLCRTQSWDSWSLFRQDKSEDPERWYPFGLTTKIRVSLLGSHFPNMESLKDPQSPRPRLAINFHEILKEIDGLSNYVKVKFSGFINTIRILYSFKINNDICIVIKLEMRPFEPPLKWFKILKPPRDPGQTSLHPGVEQIY